MPLPGLAPRSIRFCPYEDILGVGHTAGFSSMLVPGSGISQFDSGEADVYESYGRRREREVRSVMEKIQPDLITMDTDAFLGRVGDGGVANRPVHGPTVREVPFYKKTRAERLEVLGKADTEDAGVLHEEDSADEDASGDEAGVSKPGQGAKRREKVRQEKEKHKMRGKAKSSKRFLRKKRKNVVDPTTVRPTLFADMCWTDLYFHFAGGCQRKAGAGTCREGQAAEDCVWRAKGRGRRFIAVRVELVKFGIHCIVTSTEDGKPSMRVQPLFVCCSLVHIDGIKARLIQCLASLWPRYNGRSLVTIIIASILTLHTAVFPFIAASSISSIALRISPCVSWIPSITPIVSQASFNAPR